MTREKKKKEEATVESVASPLPAARCDRTPPITRFGWPKNPTTPQLEPRAAECRRLSRIHGRKSRVRGDTRLAACLTVTTAAALRGGGRVTRLDRGKPTLAVSLVLGNEYLASSCRGAWLRHCTVTHFLVLVCCFHACTVLKPPALR